MPSTLPHLSPLVKQTLKHLRIKYPMIQAPMAGVSTPLLAATISNNGGLGSIGLGASNHHAARKMILETQRLLSNKDGAFNVNLFVHQSPRSMDHINSKWLERLQPYFVKYGGEIPKGLNVIYKSFLEDQDMLDVLLETKPPIISFHFGIPPLNVLSKLKENGSILMATATNLREAKLIEETGLIDYIVSQGYEAGGHRGIFQPNPKEGEDKDERLSTFVLSSLLLKKCKIPIIAAGGIMDGKSIKAYLDIGCAGVQLGTAFVGCPESSADQAYKDKLFSKDSEKTTMTRLISGRPARSLVNEFTKLEDELLDLKDGDVPDYPLTYDVGKKLNVLAKSKGEHGFGAHWAGQGAPLARKLDAKEMLETLVKEWKATEDRIESKL